MEKNEHCAGCDTETTVLWTCVVCGERFCADCINDDGICESCQEDLEVDEDD